jgi:membrane-associated phospholipid phosphatase
MFSSIHGTITHWDFVAWYYLNTRWHNAFLDAILPWFREPWFWSPLYLFLLIFMPYKFGKKGWLWCLFFLISFIISDQVSGHLMKPYFERLRPCNYFRVSNLIHLIVPCGGMYGFPSSHATNHFSLALFSAVTLGRRVKWIWPVALCWALLVSYSQVYVGVHYPLDVTVGGLIGAAIGLGTGTAFNRFFRLADRVVAAS